jgi:RNA polymerase sigma factor (sigma-70 family)
MVTEQRHRLQQHFKTEHAGLFAFIRSKIPSLEEAEDLLQDVYVQAASSLNVLDYVDNLTGWLYTVAKNKIIDWYRSKRLPTVSIDESDENGDRFRDMLAEEIPDTMDDESRELVFRAITDAVDELPEKQRYVFIQQVIEGRTFRVLSRETGEPMNTLIARKRYAIRLLQGRLAEIKKSLT